MKNNLNDGRNVYCVGTDYIAIQGAFNPAGLHVEQCLRTDMHTHTHTHTHAHTLFYNVHFC